jgi:alkyl hydroperoxide reductase subunit AhpF
MLALLTRPVEVWAFLDDGSESVEVADILRITADVSHGHLMVRLFGPGEHPLERALNVDRRPMLCVLGPGGEFLPVQVVGPPRGYQFGALVRLCVNVSRNHNDLPHGVVGLIRGIVSDVRLEVRVTPTCPHSPQVVRVAESCALANPGRIAARIVDVTIGSAGGGDNLQVVPQLVVAVEGQAVAQHVGMLSAWDVARMITSSVKGAARHVGNLAHN